MQIVKYGNTVVTRLLLACAAFCVSAGVLLAVALPAGAIDTGDACKNDALKESAICGSTDENVGVSFGANLVNTMLFALGIVAVIMIIIGGIKYATADGDASKLTSAKNTILYSVIGLIVAIMAWGIVTFVVNQFR